MKIKNINKKILAGLLGTVMLTTPLGLTACGSELKENNNSYETINDYYVLTLETENGKTIWLTEEMEYIHEGKQIFTYYNVFNGENIFKTENEKSAIEGVELIRKDNFQQYLIGYDCVQKNYTKEEIEDLFNKVKEDFYNNEKGKELVKK